MGEQKHIQTDKKIKIEKLIVKGLTWPQKIEREKKGSKKKEDRSK